MSTTEELELEIFRAGDYGDKGTFSEADLDRIADDYSPDVHEAPVTVDHQQAGPAYGWVAGLKRKGDRLIARLRDLNDSFRSLVESGAFKKRSIELYRTFSDTGRPYLRALTFLGAQPPEVKGLADVTFKEDAEYVAIDFAAAREQDADATTRFSEKEQHDHQGSNPITAKATPETAPEPDEETTAAVAHPEVLNDAREQLERLREEKARTGRELVRMREALRRQELVHFCEQLKREGRFLPAWERMGVVRFMEAISSSETVQFSEDADSERTPLEWFKSFLSSLPRQVPLGEVAPSEPAVHMSEGEMPRPGKGSPISHHSVEVHQRARALCEREPDVAYSEALRRVVRGHDAG